MQEGSKNKKIYIIYDDRVDTAELQEEVIPAHPTPAAASHAAAVILAGGVQFFNLQNTVYHPC